MKNKKTPWLSPDEKTIVFTYITVGSYLISLISSFFESAYKLSKIFLCIGTFFLTIMLITLLKRSKK